jgi:L-seryl-tRNA(Ser) seleniumtransferase
VGGGSFPGVPLPAVLVVLRPVAPGPDELLRRLRDAPTPVIARIADGSVVLDPRTVLAGDAERVVRAVAGALDD